MRISILLSGVFLLFSIGLATVPGKLQSSEKLSSTTIKITAAILNPEQALGKKLFFDVNLSNPIGQSCGSCHAPANGFADPEKRFVSAGAVKSLFGTRNAGSVAYAAFTPPFQYNKKEKNYMGGFFWDGRANTLAQQAMMPLLNHLEMNTNKKLVFQQLNKQEYRQLFMATYGKAALKDTTTALINLANAIAAYEKTQEVNPFTSKFDYYLQGKTAFTKQEFRGLKLFNDPKKGNCAACHPTTATGKNSKVLLTDYTYDNIGLPANNDLKTLLKDNYTSDLGLGQIVKKTSENGKFRVPTLRNVAVTAPYFHNGVIKTLTETVQFYNQRDSGKFGTPEVKQNVNHEELGNLKLTDQEVADIVAFMETLTDGYQLQ